MPQVTKHSPEAYNWLGVITGVKITKKKTKPFLKRSTSFPIAGGCDCFADASSSPAFAYIFEGNHWLYPAAFFGRRLGLSFFVLLEIYRLGNLYLCGRELDRLHGPSDISIIIRHGRTQLDLEGQYHLTW